VPLESLKLDGLNTSGGLLTRCARELAMITGEPGELINDVVDVVFFGRPRLLGAGGWRIIASVLPGPVEGISDPNT